MSTDKNFAYCEDNGINIAWCSSITDFKYNLAQKYNDKLPVCKDKQEYNAWTKKCECPKGFNWKDNEQQCKYPVVEKVCPPPPFHILRISIAIDANNITAKVHQQADLVRQG